MDVCNVGRHPMAGIEYKWRPSGRPSKFSRTLLCGALALACAAGSMRTASATNDAPLAVVIADFDNFDTAGEDATRTAEHAGRVNAFAVLLRNDLAAGNKFKIVQLTCSNPPCSAAHMAADELMRSAREAGAKFLVYGGIHKESTLIQWGKIGVIDLEKDKLVLNRNFSFRGDTNEAFQRAAAFIVRYLSDL